MVKDLRFESSRERFGTGIENGAIFVLMTCWNCDIPFTGNVELVPSIRIDPETRVPLGFERVDGKLRLQTELTEAEIKAAIARSVTEPVCRNCVIRYKPTLAAHGFAVEREWDENRGYEPERMR